MMYQYARAPRWIAAVVLVALLCAPVALARRTLRQRLRDFLQEVQELRPLDTRSPDKYANEEAAGHWFADLDRQLATKRNDVMRASWAYSTDLTEANAEEVNEVTDSVNSWTSGQVAEAKKYQKNSKLFGDLVLQRKFRLFVDGNAFSTTDETLSQRMTHSSVTMERIYSDARAERDGKSYFIEPEMTRLFERSRDYDKLQWAWLAWRNATGPHLRTPFAQTVSDLNEAARQNGFKDAGEAWRVGSFEVDNIETITEDLFEEVRPLYEQLHAYVRRRLIERYPGRGIDPEGPIPAHLLGDMWAQQWGAIFDVVSPYPDVPDYDVTAALASFSPTKMFKTAEEFFTSIGLEPMTSVFWKESMIEKPENRSVVCHGAAEDLFAKDDFRIKMCTTPDVASLQTVHHEMGHVEYFMQYRHLANVFRSGANAAFHEAVGDTIALSAVTPRHLRAIGLLPAGAQGEGSDGGAAQREGSRQGSDGGAAQRDGSRQGSDGGAAQRDGSRQGSDGGAAQRDSSRQGSDGGAAQRASSQLDEEDYSVEQKFEINFLMKMALNKVAFLPFGYLIDKWRWDVFRGEITADEYNDKWWRLRLKYQGITPPVSRSEDDFDPGSKYHIATFVPYIRYFLSFVGQFQFHRALCDAAGHQAAPHECDIYRSKDAGKLLKSMLRLGASRPWPEAMFVLTGQRHFRSRDLLDYFRPLHDWLKKRNRNEKTGWR